MKTLTKEKQIIHNTNRTVYIFSRDLTAVFNIIKECTKDTDTDTWINNIRCGMLEMQALQDHYDGTSEARRRVTTATMQIDRSFYCHEYTVTFEKYVTALNGIFKTLERYNDPMYDTNEVLALLEKCANNHAEFKSVVLMCQILHNASNTAATYPKTEVGRILPNVRATGGIIHTIADLSSKGKGKGK